MQSKIRKNMTHHNKGKGIVEVKHYFYSSMGKKLRQYAKTIGEKSLAPDVSAENSNLQSRPPNIIPELEEVLTSAHI